MNEWFSHGQSFHSVLPPDECCSACMEGCLAEKECVKCVANLKKFKPVLNKIKVTTNSVVKKMSKLMSDLDINGKTPRGTPAYDTSNLAETLVANVIEFKSLETFEEFLNLFSLGMEISKVLLEFIKSNFDELVIEKVDLENIESVERFSKEDSYSDGSESETLHDSRFVALLLLPIH